MLINPRLIDYHGVSASQADLHFAIPFFREDIPLYVEPRNSIPPHVQPSPQK
jgi:hypothetical protein